MKHIVNIARTVSMCGRRFPTRIHSQVIECYSATRSQTGGSASDSGILLSKNSLNKPQIVGLVLVGSKNLLERE